MEIIVWIIGIILALGFISWIIEVIENWRNSIDWTKFFLALIVGGGALAVLFNFTSEGVLVIIGAYIVLLIVALIFGTFKKKLW